ncbi:hypothetical protein [Microvirga calopogonii]|uniref:hypothetical protein n=1 Tax=Microvirga calopogonii TaxID=2078013 RepID=UPI000E0D7CB1|nr:hypothetical protein [Microvirga calopogonii]
MKDDINPAPEPLPAELAEPATLHSGVWLTMLASVALLAAVYVLPSVKHDASSPASQPEISAETATRLEAGLSGLALHLHPVDLSTLAAQEEAVKAMPVSEAQGRKLIADALAGRQNLGRIVVWDNVSQDGDVISVSSGGLSTNVSLKSTPQTIILPYAKGGSLMVAGVQDGGGGITVGMDLPTGPLPLPPLKVGEVRVLPLF